MLTSFGSLHSQIVTTYAGIPDSVGYTDGPIESSTFNNPHGIAVGTDGTIYIADRFNHTIRKIGTDGIVSTIAGQAGLSGDLDGSGAEALFYEPWGITVDNSDNIFVADTRNNKIRKISPEGNVTTYAGTGSYGISSGPGNVSTFGFPTGIDVDSDGNVYVADHNTHIIRRISISGFVTTIAGTPYILGDVDGAANAASFNRPYGLTVDQEGNIYVADEWNHKIRKISTDGIVSTVAGEGSEGDSDGIGEDAEFRFPWDITIDDDGDLYVADGFNYAIRKIVLGNENVVTTYAGTLGTAGAFDGYGNGARFVSTTGIAYSAYQDEIFVADAYNDIIRRVTDINHELEVQLVEGAVLDCPENNIRIEVSPKVFEAYEYYINGDLVELSQEPFFETTHPDGGTHQIRIIPYYDLIPGNKAEFEFERYEVEQATIQAASELIFFEGDSVELQANEGVEYFWSTGETTRDIMVNTSQEVTVEVIDDNGCASQSAVTEVEVTPIPPVINAVLNGPVSFCLSQNISLSTNYSSELQWYLDGEAIQDATEVNYFPLQSGLYQVEHTLENGLTIISEPVEVEVISSPILDFSANNIVRPLDRIEIANTSENVTDVSWILTNGTEQFTSSEFNPIFELETSGEYDLTLIGENGNTGCLDTLNKEEYIKVLSESDLPDDVFVANIFTPNNDGNNDILFARGKDLVSLDFMVYDQQGQLVFRSTDKQIGWDGRIKGSDPISANYHFVLKYINRFGTSKALKGKVVLLR